MSNKITCPKCNFEIEITQVMEAQLRTQLRAELESELEPAKKAVEKQATELRNKQAEIDRLREGLNEQVRTQVATEREKITAEARKKAADDLAVELKDRDEQLKEAQAKLKDAQDKEAAWRKKERQLVDREDALRQQQEDMAAQIKQQVATEKAKLVEEARRNAANEFTAELKDRDQQITEFEAKLKKAQDTELDLRKRERELKRQSEELELNISRRLDEEREKVRADALKKAAEDHQFKDAEKDRKISDMVKQIDELKRKAEQGSQQTQGEVMELALEDLLKQAFPADSIEEVPKGITGGDVIQRVRTSAGVDCGTILWESKRTKIWQDTWLPKLRKDQRDAGAAVAIIVSTTMPQGVDNFKQMDGAWVCSWACAASVAAAVRAGMLEVGKVRRALEGQQGKMEQVYHYLASPQFRNRVAGIVEAFVTMKSDLDAEKRAITKHWSKREKQIEQAVFGTAGMYGDFQGIIGGTLPEIEGISLPQLEAHGSDGDGSEDGNGSSPAGCTSSRSR